MPFSSPPEIATLAALDKALQPLGYRISQQMRVLDAVRAAAADPKATATPGPTMQEFVLTRLREAARPFDQNHRWLRPGDWNYTLCATRRDEIDQGVRCPPLPRQHRHGYAAGLPRGLPTGHPDRLRS